MVALELTWRLTALASASVPEFILPPKLSLRVPLLRALAIVFLHEEARLSVDAVLVRRGGLVVVTRAEQVILYALHHFIGVSICDPVVLWGARPVVGTHA